MDKSFQRVIPWSIYREVVAGDYFCNDFCYNGGTYTQLDWDGHCDCPEGTSGVCCEEGI